MLTHAAGGPGWRASSSFGVRHAGLPASALHELRFDETFAHLDRMLRRQRWIEDEGAQLSEVLHPVIGAAHDDLRPRLVGLRRAVYQARRPRRTEWDHTVADALPAATSDRVRRWIAAVDELSELTAAAPRILAAEHVERLAVLRKTAEDPLFLRALSQASPALSSQLDKWHRQPGRRLRARTVLGLTNFLTRAATKTSPYSTFTLSGRGDWAQQSDAVLPGDPGRPVGVLELHGMIERGVALELAARPTLAERMRVRPNPSITPHGRQVSFLGAGAHEPLVTITVTPAIRECLRLAANNPPLGRLRAELGGRQPDAAGRMVAKLLSVGLLELQPPVTDQSSDALGEWAAWLRTVDGADHPMVDPLLRLRAALRREIDVANVPAHRARQHELHAAVDAVSGELQIARHDDGPRKVAFHENAVYLGPVLHCGPQRWSCALDALDAFRGFLGILDPTLPLRIALAEHVRRVSGAGTELSYLDFHRTVHEVLKGEQDGLAAEIRAYYDITTPAPLELSSLPQVRQLHLLRERARTVLRAEPGPDGVVRVEPDTLRALVAAQPAWIRAPRSLACYLQVVAEQPVQLVLNLATPGYGKGRSRLFRLIGDANPTGDAPRLDTVADTAPLLAEIGGTFTSTVNRRLPAAPYEIDYPGTFSARPTDERIALDDLRVRHDPYSGELTLRSARLDRRIQPAHLGMMAEFLLPPAARLLGMAFGDTHLVHPSIPLLSTVAESLDVSEGPRSAPRTAVGDLVVQRARWMAAVQDVPDAVDVHGWARLLRWLRQHGVPERCFVRVWGRDSDDDAVLRRWVLGKTRKPLYVDFANWFQVRAFAHLLAGGGEVAIFEEALPDPALAAPSARVTEYLMEISATEAGR